MFRARLIYRSRNGTTPLKGGTDSGARRAPARREAPLCPAENGQRARRGGQEPATTQHAGAPHSAPLKSTACPPRGSGACRALAHRVAPLCPAENLQRARRGGRGPSAPQHAGRPALPR